MRCLPRNLTSSAANRISPAWRRLLPDNRGVAAVEFALILPIMFFLFVGTIEFSQALSVDRRVTQAASSTADLIARAPDTGMTTAQVDSELQIITQLMRPYDVGPLQVRIISVVAKSTNGVLRYLVNWSRDTSGGTPYARNSTYTNMPQNLLSATESIIIAEASYNYTPLIFKYFIKAAFSLQQRSFLKPRNAMCVRLDGESCVS